MKKLLFLLVLVSGFAFGQETEFKFTKDGFTDYVVTECNGKTAVEMYKKTLDWISVTYKNPKEVIKAQIENDYIRIEGVKDGLVSGFMGSTFPIKYQIEISLKNDKYKFEVLEIEYFTPASQYSSGGWRKYEIKDVKDHYKSSGELKSKFKNEHETFPTYFNELNKSLKEFVLSNTIPSKKSDW